MVERPAQRADDHRARNAVEAYRAADEKLRDLLQTPADERAERIRAHEEQHREWQRPTLPMLACVMLDVEVRSVHMPCDRLLAYLRYLAAKG